MVKYLNSLVKDLKNLYKLKIDFSHKNKILQENILKKIYNYKVKNFKKDISMPSKKDKNGDYILEDNEHFKISIRKFNKEDGIIFVENKHIEIHKTISGKITYVGKLLSYGITENNNMTDNLIIVKNNFYTQTDGCIVLKFIDKDNIFNGWNSKLFHTLIISSFPSKSSFNGVFSSTSRDSVTSISPTLSKPSNKSSARSGCGLNSILPFPPSSSSR